MAEHLWEQQPDESEKAYLAFCSYRDLGPDRVADAAYRKHSNRPEAPRAPGRWDVWAREHRWTERAKAYDLHLEAEARKKAVAEHIRDRILSRANEPARA